MVSIAELSAVLSVEENAPRATARENRAGNDSAERENEGSRGHYLVGANKVNGAISLQRTSTCLLPSRGVRGWKANEPIPIRGRTRQVLFVSCLKVPIERSDLPFFCIFARWVSTPSRSVGPLAPVPVVVHASRSLLRQRHQVGIKIRGSVDRLHRTRVVNVGACVQLASHFLDPDRCTATKEHRGICHCFKRTIWARLFDNSRYVRPSWLACLEQAAVAVVTTHQRRMRQWPRRH